MKKRVLAGLLMSVMVLASAMSVSAADSKTKPVEGGTTADGKGTYVATTENPDYSEVTDKEVITKIEKINKGETVSLSADVDEAIKGKTLVQKFFDIEPEGDHSSCTTAGKHRVPLTVDAMTTKWKNIVVVHYSVDKTKWEVIPVADKDVDYNKKTIVVEVTDFSPFVIYADIVEDGAAGTSPSTEGVSSAWMLYAAMALIVLGSGVVVYQKKRG